MLSHPAVSVSSSAGQLFLQIAEVCDGLLGGGNIIKQRHQHECLQVPISGGHMIQPN